MSKIFAKDKLKVSIVGGIILLVLGAFILLKDSSQAKKNEAKLAEKVISVKVQKAGEFGVSDGQVKYPATVVGDQEIKLTAGVSGTATAVNFNLGDKVNAGKLLVKIDDIGGELEREGDGFVSGQIQQLRNALEQAEENYDLAKDNYKEDKTDANKSAKDIAELQRENAKIALRAGIDGRNIKAPISGTIISKDVSAGDSVSLGQLLATVSRTERLKIRFFADRENLGNLKVGGKIKVRDGEKESGAKIVSISPIADEATKRFLVEAQLDDSKNFLIGTIVDVLVDSIQEAAIGNSLILPLSALTIAQNESYFFIAEDGRAKKVPAEILRVSGETAEVLTNLSSDVAIIVEGNKLVQEGEGIEISNSSNF